MTMTSRPRATFRPRRALLILLLLVPTFLALQDVLDSALSLFPKDSTYPAWVFEIAMIAYTALIAVAGGWVRPKAPKAAVVAGQHA